jgi:hypothetical protein
MRSGFALAGLCAAFIAGPAAPAILQCHITQKVISTDLVDADPPAIYFQATAPGTLQRWDQGGWRDFCKPRSGVTDRCRVEVTRAVFHGLALLKTPSERVMIDLSVDPVRNRFRHVVRKACRQSGGTGGGDLGGQTGCTTVYEVIGKCQASAGPGGGSGGASPQRSPSPAHIRTRRQR